MELRPPSRTAKVLESRAEQRLLTESAKATLVALFALTTQGCGVCFDRQHDVLERKAAAEKDRADAEAKAEKPEAKVRREFKASLVELEKAGYSIEISGINLIGDISGQITAEMFSDMSGIKDTLSHNFETGTGVTVVENGTNPLAVLKQELDASQRDHSKKIRVPIYRMILNPNSAGITFTVENWLTDQTLKTGKFESLNSNKDGYAA